MLLKKITVLAAIFFSIFALSSAASAAQEFVLRNGQAFKVASNGSEKLIEGAEVEVHEGDDGKTIYSLTVEERGIYFFDKNEKFISFLPRKDASMSYVLFSPSMARFVLDSGTYVDREYLLYQFEGLKQKKSFYGVSELVWVDNMRFVFTLIDTGKKGRREDIPGWLSVVMYDTAMEELFTIIPATDTADYMLETVNSGENLLQITEFSVKNKADWADEEKVEMREITEKIPAAG